MIQSWDLLNTTVYERYVASGDMNTAAIPDLEEILDYSRRSGAERGGISPVDVLIYVGVTDVVCNPDGVLEALRLADWEGKMDFRGKPWMELPWLSSSGNRAGRVKAVPNLWFVEVEEAGHMVPFEQPLVALSLMKQWLGHLDQTREAADPTMAATDQVIMTK
ncbi:hypothetical protein NQ176_g8005 [Zarea fungicola]|uniref:Uncharacterized protein n=1 Tax=Zarea fungicola TaxID=93591 RepID=A0ACC1MUY1_9HYPO|nr:hypothetical protein NQ176_g8005 [Lecanicillium fungicola]